MTAPSTADPDHTGPADDLVDWVDLLYADCPSVWRTTHRDESGPVVVVDPTHALVDSFSGTGWPEQVGGKGVRPGSYPGPRSHLFASDDHSARSAAVNRGHTRGAIIEG